MSIETDEEGRLSLPERLRERYGEQYHVVERANRVELVPVSDDPLEAVCASAGGLQDASIEAIRADIEVEARKDVRSRTDS